jgi:hypothetical protein
MQRKDLTLLLRHEEIQHLNLRFERALASLRADLNTTALSLHRALARSRVQPSYGLPTRLRPLGIDSSRTALANTTAQSRDTGAVREVEQRTTIETRRKRGREELGGGGGGGKGVAERAEDAEITRPVARRKVGRSKKVDTADKEWNAAGTTRAPRRTKPRVRKMVTKRKIRRWS